MDTLLQVGIGSTDGVGGRAPAGGVHTGTARITMMSGATFLVAHDRAEVLAKLDAHAVAPTTPRWVCFDKPNVSTPIVLNANLVTVVQ